jgi:hypothetical protein
MTSFELLAAFYFAGLGVAAVAAPVSCRRRAGVMALCGGIAAAVATIGRGGSESLRWWLPHAYLVAGYWIPTLLTRPPVAGGTRFEQWLMGSDRRCRRVLPGVPAPLVHLTELAYLLCYPLVPASFIVVYSLGTTADIARFWVAVLAAGFACYVTLPWLPSRPPRLLAGAGGSRDLGAVNAFVLGRVSHQLNTFPSGHVAVSCAAAGALWPVSPPAGLVVAVIAAAVAVGAAAGRYHYVADVLLGAAVGALALAASLIRTA